MKKILVTGGSGMVGRYLQELLPSADFPSSKKLNLLSPTAVKEYITLTQPEVVIHLAALVGGIIDNSSRQLAYFEQNLEMDYNVLKACHQTKVPRLITTLSTCAYPDTLEDLKNFKYPLQEGDVHFGPPAATNFGYGYAKRVMGVHIDIINQTNPDLKYCYLYPCNLFGEYDKYDNVRSHFVGALLSKIIVARSQNKSYIELLGTGAPLRQFFYAKDLARLIVRMVESESYANLNVCPSEVRSIDTIARDTLNALGLSHFEIKYNGGLDGQFRKDASNKKMLELFPDFKLTEFSVAIKQTYDYLLGNQVL